VQGALSPSPPRVSKSHGQHAAPFLDYQGQRPSAMQQNTLNPGPQMRSCCQTATAPPTVLRLRSDTPLACALLVAPPGTRITLRTGVSFTKPWRGQPP
jgi:hypothetical protein